MIRIAIVEDERTEAEQLGEYLDRFAGEYGEEIQHRWFESTVEFLECYQRQFDLILMDIRMPCIDGMRAAERLRELDSTVGLIFVTSLAQYAVRGYSVGALDYILKPVNYPALALKLQRAVVYCGHCPEHSVLLRTNSGVVRLNVRQIQYIEIFNHHILYRTAEGSLRGYGTLKQVEAALPDRGFFRCSNQCIVNLNYVTKIEGDMVTAAGRSFLISRLRKKAFMDALHRYYKKLD